MYPHGMLMCPSFAAGWWPIPVLMCRYGRMLTVLAQYISVANDTTIITGTADIAAHVDAVLAMIKIKIAVAKRLPVSHIAHGLLMGCDEADSCTEYSTYTGTFGELPCDHTLMRLVPCPFNLGRGVSFAKRC